MVTRVFKIPNRAEKSGAPAGILPAFDRFDAIPIPLSVRGGAASSARLFRGR